jgi:hypothetical protein
MSLNDPPPAWLEAAARLDALIDERVPLAPPPDPPPPVDDAPDEEDLLPAEPEPQPRLSAAPVVVPEMPADPADAREETDLGWYGYAAVALLPSTAALGLLTAGALWKLRPLLPPGLVAEAVYAPLAALWAGQAFRLAYRLLAYSYRLTTRRLFRDRGRLYGPEEPLDLATVAQVELNQTVADRLVGVGTVIVVPEEAVGRPPVELIGVYRPRLLAARIEEAALAARAGNVVAMRVALDGPPA